jgi:hypothetical protein
MSHRPISRYLNPLGLEKIRNKYFQVVSDKKRLERIYFTNVALAFNDKCFNSIFIDE